MKMSEKSAFRVQEEAERAGTDKPRGKESAERRQGRRGGRAAKKKNARPKSGREKIQEKNAKAEKAVRSETRRKQSENRTATEPQQNRKKGKRQKNSYFLRRRIM